jgi:hypothetical protein
MRRFAQAGSFLMLAAGAVALALIATPARAQQRQALQTHVSAPADARLLGRMPGAQELSLALTLPLHNQQELQSLLQQLYNPSSPQYHQFLSVPQFTEQFAPTFVDYQRLIGFMESYGLTVTHTTPNRVVLDVSGTVANIEQAFGVTMKVYQHPTEHRTFYAPDGEPSVEAGMPVQGISGLSNFEPPRSRSLKRGPQQQNLRTDQTGSGPGGQFLGSDRRAAYYGGTTLTGAGQAVGLYGLNFRVSDVLAYFNNSAVSQPLTVPVVTVSINGYDTSCGAGCDDGEPVIDIIESVSMAPGLGAVIEYEASNDVDTFNRMATDNVAKSLSASIGFLPADPSSDQPIFQEFAAQGQNLFVASGDSGAFTPPSCSGNCNPVFYPADDPFITAVGGTDLTTATAGGAWASETAWIGSSGGYSTDGLLIPSYQTPVINGSNQGSTTLRNIPDVAAQADTDNFYCANGSCQGGIGGTSLSAPTWAGYLALANEQAAANGDTIGFLNPTIYTIGQGSSYSADFHDITSGNDNNGLSPPTSYNAVTGYDLVTGWGSPNGQGLINALAPASSSPYFTLSASPGTLSLTPGTDGMSTVQVTSANGFSGTVDLSAKIVGLPAGVTASFNPASVTGSGSSTLTVSTTSLAPGGNLALAVIGTSGGMSQTAFVTIALPDFALSAVPNGIYINQGATATSTVTVTPQNGFSGSVTLSSVSGLPSGVTASFNPTTTTSTSTLTLTANSTVATGSGTALSINGTSGNITQSLSPVTLAVSAATGTGGSGTPVDLTSAYNLTGIYNDGTTFSSTGGLDGEGSAYSSNLLTGNRILNGVQFNFGPANKANAVSGTGQTITLPAGQFTTLQLLAASFNGPVLSQHITITYTDNTTTSITQSFSDWCGCSTNPGQQAGESFAVLMPYRDLNSGTADDRQFNLYGYAFVLNSVKTVKSFTLPNNRDVVVLAATLSSQSLGTQVSLASEFNVAGIYDNNVTFPASGGMDGGGNGCTLQNGCADGYSAQQLGLTSTVPPTLTVKGVVFNFGSVNTTDCTSSCTLDAINLNPGVTITLPAGQQNAYTTMSMLGTGVQGSHTGTVTITYTTGSVQKFNQTFSDWCSPISGNPNETIAVAGMDRINSDGTLQMNTTCNLYAYTYTLDSTRVVKSIALANTDGTNFSLVLAITLTGNTSSTQPAYSLSAGTASPASISPGASSTATVTVTPANGYTGTVTLSCSISPVVAGAAAPTCAFGSTSPVSVTSGGGSATVTFNAVGASGAAFQGPLSEIRSGTSVAQSTITARPSGMRFQLYALWLPLPGLALTGFGLGSRGSRRKRILGVFLLWIALVSLMILPGCGGSGYGGGGGGGGCPGAPSVPSGLAASSTTSSGTTLTWSAPTSVPSGCSVTGYTVYQNGTSIATSTTTSYNVTGLSSATMYSFTVAATDSYGASAQSSAVNVTTLSNGTPAGTYTISITGQDANGVTQTGAPATVNVTVN